MKVIHRIVRVSCKLGSASSKSFSSLGKMDSFKKGICLPLTYCRNYSATPTHSGLNFVLARQQSTCVWKRYFRTSSFLWQEKTVQVPPFPESVTEGDLRWQKKVGDAVKADEVVGEIETDKTAIPVPAPGAGVITAHLAKDGTTVKPGQPIFKIKLGASGGAPPAKAAAGKAPKPKPDKPPSSDGAVVRLPPVDPTRQISGTRTEFRVKMNRMRQTIANRLKEAQNVNAMLTTFNEIDMSSIISFRKANQKLFQNKFKVKLGFMSAFIKAAAYALQDQPVVNAVISGTEVVYRDYIDISIAVATPKGLVVPVMRNVESMNYGDIEKALTALGAKAKAGKLALEDVDGGTFTISNGGVFGSLMGTPIINPPQSAILGMHGTFERPVAIKGKVVVRPMMYVALTYDHRLIDGREAVFFLRKIKAGVEDPRIIVAGL